MLVDGLLQLHRLALLKRKRLLVGHGENRRRLPLPLFLLHSQHAARYAHSARPRSGFFRTLLLSVALLLLRIKALAPNQLLLALLRLVRLLQILLAFRQLRLKINNLGLELGLGLR